MLEDATNILLWAVRWKAFNRRGTGAEVYFGKETLVVMKDGLEGRNNGSKILLVDCFIYEVQQDTVKVRTRQEHKIVRKG